MTAPTNIVATDLDIYNLLCDSILDDSIDQDTAARILSSAKNDIELTYKPDILITEDTTQTRNSGDVYTTMKSLPADFRFMQHLYVGTIEYHPIPFGLRIKYRYSPLRYYIDHKNSQFAICGSGGAGDAITQVYLPKTNDITSASITAETETILWPAEHRELVAWHAAQLLSSGTDVAADDLTFRMSAAQRNRYEEVLKRFISWDHDLKLASMNNRVGMDREGEGSDVEDILPYL